jgi:pimeloyl-ACP methyl ester carboxylesterase
MAVTAPVIGLTEQTAGVVLRTAAESPELVETLIAADPPTASTGSTPKLIVCARAAGCEGVALPLPLPPPPQATSMIADSTATNLGSIEAVMAGQCRVRVSDTG